MECADPAPAPSTQPAAVAAGACAGQPGSAFPAPESGRAPRSGLMHIVSNVEGLLKDGISNIDVLRATFPAGTLTGAPKIRAMQVKRGP